MSVKYSDLKKILFSFSLVAVVAMFAQINLATLIVCGVLLIASAVFFFIKKIDFQINSADFKNKRLLLFTLITDIFACYIFYARYRHLSEINLFLEILFSPLLAIIIAVIAFPSLFVIFKFLLNRFSVCDSENEITEVKKVRASEYIFLLITAFAVILICSKSSPLYPFNNWVDSNCFFTVAKSMAHGQILYKDIFEQKGPLLYFLHIPAYLISHTTFLGVFFLEVAECFVFLFFAYKTIKLLYNKAPIWLIPILAAVIYSTSSFEQGDSAEEMCLPVLMFCFYIGFKAIKNRKPLKLYQYFLVGLAAGYVLWIKYIMLGFFIGWFILIAITAMKDREFKNILLGIAMIATGVIVISVPIFVYFACNNAIYDMFYAYFYDNIVLYSVTDSEKGSFLSPLINIFSGCANAIGVNIGIFIFTVTGLLSIKDKKCFLYELSALLFMIFTVFVGGRSYIYYSFIFSLFVPVGFASIAPITDRMSEKLTDKKYKAVAFSSIIVCTALSFCLSPNIYFMKYSKSDLPQYKFKEIIMQEDNPTLLNYGFLDGGFYTVCDIVPSCKYFCRLNVPLKEMYQVQDEFIREGKIDFVVTQALTLDSDNYELISQVDDYRLYKKIK